MTRTPDRSRLSAHERLFCLLLTALSANCGGDEPTIVASSGYASGSGGTGGAGGTGGNGTGGQGMGPGGMAPSTSTGVGGTGASGGSGGMGAGGSGGGPACVEAIDCNDNDACTVDA